MPEIEQKSPTIADCICGIYFVFHRETGRGYVGSSTNIGRRFSEHRNAAINGSMNCFHRAIREIGAKHFEWTVLEECPSGILVDRELYWIKAKNSASLEGFNTVSDPKVYPFGLVRTPATIERIRQSRFTAKKRKFSEEACRNISRGLTGRPVSDVTKERIRCAQIGKYVSPETGHKISAAKLGSRHSPETIQRMKTAHTLRWANIKSQQHGQTTKAR